ncbi:endolytic transglycosylase MltG [Streptomyces sp. SID8382]|uniref:endolytic transglycosylase MltG n=1 Tax=Streptomyces malaysiensis TaxID=92644 RepID=UPI000C2C96CD|nr:MULTISPECIES: endolytic transglycosylase MltG [unclassified Streptomyces]AUA10000.1 putative aminodeoxychorismate lyase [Streptomyces sp. M56]MYX56253.1 endolytic transglycosylase MltG [Streptomyces sp. SID8382]
MTEYGRGPGSQPWHPEDPLYGDREWSGHAVSGQDPYAQDPYARDAYAQDPYGQGSHGQDPYGQGSYGQGSQGPDPYGQDPYGHQQYPHGYPQDPQQHQQPQWDGQDGGGYPHQGHPQEYPGQGGPYPGHDGSYGGMDPHDPYGGQGAPYPGQDVYQGQQQAPEAPMGPHGAHVPQQTQQMPTVPAEHQVPRQREAPEEQFIQAEDEEDHPFFTGGGDGRDVDDEADDDEDGERTGKKGRPKKRRSGVACLFVTVVLVGAVGGGGYFAYDFWQTRFGPAPDYSGEGTGQIEVEVPSGSGNAEIGSILADKGVIKSSGAFVEAVEDSGKFVQPGTYTLRKEMSGAAAVKLMLDPSSSNALIVTEGMRDATIYAAIDKKIGLKAGTTADVAKKEAKNLGLPSWANDNSKIKDPLEGFLYPSRYSVGKGAKPADVLRKMVAEASRNYGQQDLEGKAKELGLESPLQLISVASLVQAEGITHDDFRKMAEVVYNRLKPANPETYGKVEFDSTYNYIKNQSKIDIPISEIKQYNNPYNTYFYKGLPPGPIGNPGHDALKAAMNPTGDGWYYFISLNGKTSEFSKTYADHQKWVAKFNKQRKSNG